MNGALAIASAPSAEQTGDLKPHAGFKLPVCLHKNKMRPFGPVRTEERRRSFAGAEEPCPQLLLINSSIAE
jgi:hypothetical protein